MRATEFQPAAQTAPPPTARLVAAPAGIRSTTRRLAGSMRTTCSANGSASHTPPPPSAIVWLKPSSGPPPVLTFPATRLRLASTTRTRPPVVATQAAVGLAATAVGTPSRGISATTRWRAGSTRSRTPRSPSPWEATQTAPRVALTEMASRSGPPREIRATTRLLAGSIRQTAPGTAIGTHTAPAPKANPEGPTAAYPAPNAMPYGKPPVPMVATTADRGAVVTRGPRVAEAGPEGSRLAIMQLES